MKQKKPVRIFSQELNYDNEDFIVVAIKDITPEKKLEQELAKSDDVAKSVIKSIPEKVLIIDRDGIILTPKMDWIQTNRWKIKCSCAKIYTPAAENVSNLFSTEYQNCLKPILRNLSALRQVLTTIRKNSLRLS